MLAAASDTPAYPAQCIADVSVTSSDCLIDPTGKLTTAPATRARVVLIGDSHAGEFFDAVQRIAAQNNWSVEVLNKVGCPLATVATIYGPLKREYSECDTWRTNALNRLATEPAPQIIFFTQLNVYGQSQPTMRQGWYASLTKLRRIAAPMVYLKDTPFPVSNIPTCISGALTNWQQCAIPRYLAERQETVPIDAGVAATIDIDPYLCPPTGATCPAVRGGVLLYRDDSHVTKTAMLQLEPLIGQELINAKILNGQPRPLPAPTVP